MYLKKNWLAAVTMAAMLAACGGGGGSTGGDENTAPASRNTVNVTGKVTASREGYFEVAAAANKLRTSAKAAMASAKVASSCDSQYSAQFSALPKDVDSNSDGTPDLNITSEGGVVAFAIDTNGDGTADLNIDSDGNGELDKLVDDDCDGTANYSLIDANTVAVIGAEVRLTNRETGQTVVVSSGQEAGFTQIIDMGTYDVETIGSAADHAVIWGHARGKQITADGDLGAIGMHRNPLIKEVLIDGSGSGELMQATYTGASARRVVEGDTVALRVIAQDPNNRSMTLRAFRRAGSIYGELPVGEDGSVNYTVTADDMAASELVFAIEADNADGRTGADAFRDARVEVRYIVGGEKPTLPELDGFKVNGTLHANGSPDRSMTITAAPTQPDANISLEALFDAAAPGNPKMTFAWRTAAGVNESQEGATATVPGYVTAGVYTVKVAAYLQLQDSPSTFHVSSIEIPVGTTDRPAQLAGILVNGADPTGKVYRIGDTLTLKASASDPQGRAMEYQFRVSGGAVTESAWQASDSITYTITAADVTSTFTVQVCVKNDDGRVLDATSSADSCGSYPMTTSE